jgi:hypothetical protein
MKDLKIQHKIALGVSAAIAIIYAVAKIKAFKNADSGLDKAKYY